MHCFVKCGKFPPIYRQRDAIAPSRKTQPRGLQGVEDSKRVRACDDGSDWLTAPPFVVTKEHVTMDDVTTGHVTTDTARSGRGTRWERARVAGPTTNKQQTNNKQPPLVTELAATSTTALSTTRGGGPPEALTMARSPGGGHGTDPGAACTGQTQPEHPGRP